MPVFLIPALTSIGLSGAVAGPLANILFTGLSIALSILFKPKVPTPQAGQTTFKQPIPNRIRVIGRRRSGISDQGAYMLYHSYKGSTFYGVKALCEGEVGAFTRIWFHEDVVEFQDDGFHIDGIGQNGKNRYGNEKCIVYYRYGVPHETSYADIFAELGSRLSPDGIWTTDHRLDGIASIMLRAADAGADQQAARFPFGIPEISAEIIATRVFDPRRGGPSGGGTGASGRSGLFSLGAHGTFESGVALGEAYYDPSTWDFAGNDNPILQTMWLVTAPISQGGFGLDFAESFGTVLADVADQADVCDEPVPLKAGGTEKRYLSGALFKFSDDPSDVLAAILGTCDGFLAERGDGAFELKAGKWDDDDFAIVIKDRHIISLHVERFRPDEDEVTGVIVKYNSLVHNHQVIDAPVWPRDAYQGGEDHRVRPIEILFCPSGTQAQRLSKRVATYEMATISGTAVLNMFGALLMDRRGCTIQCTDDPALANAKCRLTRLEANLVERTWTIDFTVFDPVACDEWDPGTEEGPLQPVVTVPLDDVNTIPANLNAVASQIQAAVYVDLAFDPGDTAGPNESFHVRYRLTDIGGGIPGNWAKQDFSPGQVEKPADNLWIVTINPVPQAQLEFQIAGGSSQYSTSAFADALHPAPGRPTGFTAVLSGVDVVLNWTTPDSNNYASSHVFRGIHGGGFGLATDISGPVSNVGQNLPETFTDIAPPPGDYDYWVTAANGAVPPVSSLPRGPDEVLVP